MMRGLSTLLAVWPLAVTPLTGAQDLSVYISADMEGIAALSGTDDPLARRLMTDEVNAAIEGAFAAGASRVVVNDAHGSHTNLLQDRLDARVTLVRGDLKPYGMMEGLDSSHDAVVFIGYHGRAGSIGSFAAHTGSGRVHDLRINGSSVGEGGMNALYAHWHGVPVAFVSGDGGAVRQLAEVQPGVPGTAVKSGIWNRSVMSLSPDSARAAIRRGVRDALQALPSAPERPVPPFQVDLTYSTTTMADIAEGIPGVTRAGPATVRFRVDDYPAAYRLIRLLYKHLQ